MDSSVPTDPAGRDELIAVLRSGLDAVPVERRGRDWLMASVFVNALFRHDGHGTFSQLRDLKVESSEGEFTEAIRKVFAVLEPFTVGAHGYRRSLASRDSDTYWQIVSEGGELLQALGYECFINSGTLLGVIRDNDFIPHDDDADLAVVVPGCDIESVAYNWFVLKSKLKECGRIGFEGPRPLHWKLKARPNFDIDLFPCWINDGRVFIWPHTAGELCVEDLLPLRVQSISSVSVNVPAQPEKVLELNYGPGWRIPDPSWKFDWQGAWKKFAEFRAAFRAEKKREKELDVSS